MRYKYTKSKSKSKRVNIQIQSNGGFDSGPMWLQARCVTFLHSTLLIQRDIRCHSDISEVGGILIPDTSEGKMCVCSSIFAVLLQILNRSLPRENRPAERKPKSALTGFELDQKLTLTGFEPARVKPSRFRIYLLNHSDTVSCVLHVRIELTTSGFPFLS